MGGHAPIDSGVAAVEAASRRPAFLEAKRPQPQLPCAAILETPVLIFFFSPTCSSSSSSSSSSHSLCAAQQYGRGFLDVRGASELTGERFVRPAPLSWLTRYFEAGHQGELGSYETTVKGNRCEVESHWNLHHDAKTQPSE